MAPSHYLSQWWYRSMSSYGVTRPQWVKIIHHHKLLLYLGLEGIRYPACNCQPSTFHTTYKTMLLLSFNTLKPRQNGCHFTDDTFKRIFVNENIMILIKFSLKFVPKGPINNRPALVQITAWHRPGDKPLSEAMMVRLLTHICVIRPQWDNTDPDSMA